MNEGLAGCYLLLSSITDIRGRYISGRLSLAMLVTGVIWQLLWGRELQILLFSMIPGGVLLLIAYLFPKAMGKGDADMTLVLGVLIGVWDCVMVLYLAMLLLLVWGGIGWLWRYTMRRKYDREHLRAEYPFAPFLCIAYGGMLLLMRQG